MTAQARYTLRTAAALTGDPLVALATLNRALLARGDSALCSVAALAISRGPAEAGAARGRRPPAAAARRRRGGDRDRRCRAGARGLRRRRVGARLHRGRARPAAGRRHRRDRRGLRRGRALRRAAAAGRARRRRRPGPGRAAPRRRAAVRSPAAASTTTSRSSPWRRPRPSRRTARASRSPPRSRSPARPASEPAVDDRSQQLVERLFDAFNRRDAAAIVDLCDDRMEFFAVTAEEVGRDRPLRRPGGPQRLPRRRRQDLGGAADHARRRSSRRGDSLLVRGRVYLRSRELGIRDMPAAWIWDLHERPLRAGPGLRRPGGRRVRSFSRAARPGQSPDLRASRSTTRLR